MSDPLQGVGLPKPAPAPTPTPAPTTVEPVNSSTLPGSSGPQSPNPICEAPTSSTPPPRELPGPGSSTYEPPTSKETPTVPPEELPSSDSSSDSNADVQTTEASPTATPTPAPAPTPTPPQPVTARKHCIVLVYSVAPDVCTMPNGAIACFDLCAVGTNAVNESPNVFANSSGVIKLDTRLLVCSGDEPAAAGSLSGTTLNQVEMLPNGCTVITNRNMTIRDKDLCTMNNKNTLGIVSVEEPAPAPDDSDGPLDYIKRGLDVVDVYKDAADESDKADSEARKARKNKTGGKGGKKKGDRARARAKKQAAITKAEAKAKKLNVPGKASKAGKLARRVPGLGNAIDAYQVGKEFYEGNNGKAFDKMAGIFAGKGAALLAGGACLALGPGALVCAAVVIGADWGASYLVEEAGLFSGGETGEVVENSSPANPTPPPSENGVPGSGSSTPSSQPPSNSPVPQPAPHPTSPPPQTCVDGVGEDGVLNLCINGPSNSTE